MSADDRARLVSAVPPRLDLSSYIAERNATAAAIVTELERLIPPGQRFLLVDEGFLPVSPRLDNRVWVRFSGRWREPIGQAAAARMFERFRREGIGFVVFAWPALWWLRHYDALRRSILAATTLLDLGDGYAVFEINRAQGGARPRATDRGGNHRAATRELRKKVTALEQDVDRWRGRAIHAEQVHRIGQLARSLVPSGSQLLVVSQGDDALLRLTLPEGWHFPQMPDGVSAGKPADSAEAIAQLESLRHRGAEYLLFPRWTAWWLDYYDDLRRHLDASSTRVCDNEDCVVYDLRRGSGS
jgi:hypothetical protein